MFISPKIHKQNDKLLEYSIIELVFNMLYALLRIFSTEIQY